MVSKVFSLSWLIVINVLVSKLFPQLQFPSFCDIYFKFCNSDGKGHDNKHQGNWISFGLQSLSVKYVPGYCHPYLPSLKQFSAICTGITLVLIRWLICWGCFFPWYFIIVLVVPLVSCVLTCTLKIPVYFSHKYTTSVTLACNLALQWFKCVCF